jgi:hypothetical protein
MIISGAPKNLDLRLVYSNKHVLAVERGRDSLLVWKHARPTAPVMLIVLYSLREGPAEFHA